MLKPRDPSPHLPLQHLPRNLRRARESTHQPLFPRPRVIQEDLLEYHSINPAPPELYICVNRTIDLIRPHDMGVRVSMGCENGLIIALSRTEKGSSIFVNGKGLEEEIELSCKGNIIKNQAAEFSTIIQNAIDTGIEDCSLNALHGGIMYYHSQLPKDDKTGWLFGFTLASIVLNKMEGEYTLREIEMKIESLLQREIFKEKCLVNKLLIRGWDER